MLNWHKKLDHFVLTGTYEVRPDFNQAALMMLRTFREGALGRVNLDMDLIEESDNPT